MRRRARSTENETASGRGADAANSKRRERMGDGGNAITPGDPRACLLPLIEAFARLDAERAFASSRTEP